MPTGDSGPGSPAQPLRLGMHSASTPRGPTAEQVTYSSLRGSPCGKQVFPISVMLLKLKSSTSKER